MWIFKWCGTNKFKFYNLSTNANQNNLTSGGHTWYISLIDLQGLEVPLQEVKQDNSDGTYTVSYVTITANMKVLKLNYFKLVD